MEIQTQILSFLESNRNDILTLFFTSITILAEKTFLVLVLSILYWCIDKVKSTRLGWFIMFSAVGNGLVKNIVKMPRPYEVGVVKPLRVETATSYSFPSGHTQSATSFWTGSMIVLRTKGTVILGTIMILLTAISRLYLGVHWPMDVLGAIGFGVICVYYANQLLDESANITKWHVLGTSVICLLSLVFKVDKDLYTAVAALWGFCVGCYLEQHYIQFEMTHILKKNIYRVLIGMAGVIVIYVGIGKLLPDVKILSMLKNALVTIWIIAGAPYVFKKMVQ